MGYKINVETSIGVNTFLRMIYTWEELGYTGSEELFPLVYAKLKEVYVGAKDL